MLVKTKYGYAFENQRNYNKYIYFYTAGDACLNRLEK